MKFRNLMLIIMLILMISGFLNYHVIVSRQFDHVVLLAPKEKASINNTVIFLDAKFRRGSNPLSSLLLGLDWMRQNPSIYGVALQNGWKPEVAAKTVTAK